MYDKVETESTFIDNSYCILEIKSGRLLVGYIKFSVIFS